MNEINFIVAYDNNNGIALNGKIPWNIPEDLKRFRKITTETQDSTKQNIIIMGRKTYESLPIKPLPNRLNIIISSKNQHNVLTFSAIKPAIDYYLNNKSLYEKVFIIGGEQIYASVPMNIISYIYVTKINQNYQCDQFFPQIPSIQFTEILKEEKEGYTYITYYNTLLNTIQNLSDPF